ncbi:MAG TPA: hypothetical protein VKR43_08035 [Bryobacteraceae bacterium]|nr:hypothetical protein [Bryobacteraceae bacterium]
MLRITNTVTADEQHWTVCGRLTKPWVEELRTAWNVARVPSAPGKCVVDISDVIFIDEDGEALLRAMKADGARFVARGVDTKHLIENLKTKGKRPLRRFLTHLDPCGHQYRNE